LFYSLAFCEETILIKIPEDVSSLFFNSHQKKYKKWTQGPASFLESLSQTSAYTQRNSHDLTTIYNIILLQQKRLCNQFRLRMLRENEKNRTNQVIHSKKTGCFGIFK